MKNLVAKSALFFCAGALLALTSCSDGEEDMVLPIGLTTVDITETTITLEVTPDKNSAGYRFGLGTPDDVDAFKAGDYSKSVEINSTSSTKQIYKNLVPGNTYYIYGHCLNAQGKAAKPRIIEVATVTAPPGQLNVYFDQVKATSITVTLSSEDNVLSYGYAFGLPEIYHFDFDKIPGRVWIIPTEGNTSKTVTFSDLQPNTTYVLFFKTINKYGQGSVIYERPKKTAAQ